MRCRHCKYPIDPGTIGRPHLYILNGPALPKEEGTGVFYLWCPAKYIPAESRPSKFEWDYSHEIETEVEAIESILQSYEM